MRGKNFDLLIILLILFVTFFVAYSIWTNAGDFSWKIMRMLGGALNG